MKRGGGGGGGCELCGAVARVYCESDRARLCWGCDHKVHGANFLVGKHSRSLLCHRCQSPTPWTSSGSTITPCMSLCVSCLSLATGANSLPRSQPPQQGHQVEASSPDEVVEQEQEEEGYGSYTDDDDVDDHDDDDGDGGSRDDDDDVDDDENQVVPWSACVEKPDISVSKCNTSDYDDDEDYDDDDDDEDDDDEDDANAKTPLFSSSVLKRKRESGFLHSSDNRNTLPRL